MNFFIQIYWVIFLIVTFCKVSLTSGDHVAAAKTLYYAAAKHLTADRDAVESGVFGGLLKAKVESAVRTEIQYLTSTFLGSLETLKQKNEKSRLNNAAVESDIAYVKRIEEDSFICLSGDNPEKESESVAKERYESAKRLTLAALKYACALKGDFSECHTLMVTVQSSKLTHHNEKVPLFAHLTGAQEDTDRCEQYISEMKFENRNAAWKGELGKVIMSLGDAETVLEKITGSGKKQKDKIVIKEKIGKIKELLENIKVAFGKFAGGQEKI
ncbi:hypothetical protein DdX_19638 [Ditylenchus destructor]|uniref:Uncharacterized protein n=1 Tax=Ditylenchus destructor TaxID=166010 RepID=A0AAD4QWZ0_9BILA|nr:hypothetical protein DdX_19638 [Ditylenchus destructor]